MYAIKKMEAMLCILVSYPREKTYICVYGSNKMCSPKCTHTCAHSYTTHAHTRPLTHTHRVHTFLLIHLFSPRLICHSDDKLK